METSAIHFHCNDEEAEHLELTAGDDAAKAIWLDADPVHESRYAKLYASHRQFVDRVVCMLTGHRLYKSMPVDYPPRKPLPAAASPSLISLSQTRHTDPHS